MRAAFDFDQRLLNRRNREGDPTKKRKKNHDSDQRGMHDPEPAARFFGLDSISAETEIMTRIRYQCVFTTDEDLYSLCAPLT